MLIISHRGAAGLAPENTLEALRAGLDAGADMLEFDIRLTKDNVPILSHDFHLLRTNHKPSIIHRMTLDEVRSHSSRYPIVTLEEVLNEFYGKIILNIELKTRGSGTIVAEMIAKSYAKKDTDWHVILFSSFKGMELAKVRKVSEHAQLSLLHSGDSHSFENAFTFVAYSRRLRLTAIGLHRHNVNQLAVEIAHRSGILVYVYTVNRPRVASQLMRAGIDGIVTDHPDRMIAALKDQEG